MTTNFGLYEEHRFALSHLIQMRKWKAIIKIFVSHLLYGNSFGTRPLNYLIKLILLWQITIKV